MPSRRHASRAEVKLPSKKYCTKEFFHFVPSPAGYDQSNHLLEEGNMPADFHFLADAKLDFEPQYDFPCPKFHFFGCHRESESISRDPNSSELHFMPPVPV